MRVTNFLSLITLLLVCTALRVDAQAFDVTGDTVALLARAVVTEADTNNHIPSAYNIPLGAKDDCTTITLANACEIFARTLSEWGTNGSPYPKHVRGISFTWRPPSQLHPELEPQADQHTRIPIRTQYTQFAAEGIVRLADVDANMTIPFSWTQQNKEKLTIAQLIVAMAALIIKRLDVTMDQGESYTIARITSPENWLDTDTPYSLLPATAQPVTAITLRVALNGIPVPPGLDATVDTGPFSHPFCGTVSIHLEAGGVLRRIVILLDDKPLTAFEGSGAFGKSIDSLNYADGRHVLIITATPVAETHKPKTMTIPFYIFNGHASDFTPAETL